MPIIIKIRWYKPSTQAKIFEKAVKPCLLKLVKWSIKNTGNFWSIKIAIILKRRRLTISASYRSIKIKLWLE
jgi:hypothetical protein